MRIKILRGSYKPQYTLYINADKPIANLPQDAQKAINAIGKLTLLSEEDFTNKTDDLSNEIVMKINRDGAYFSKLVIKFEEIINI